MVRLFGEVPWPAQVVTMGMRAYESLRDLDGTKCPQRRHLSPSEFCEGLNQVTEDGQGKDLTANEMHQCRAILGAAQWRSYQTAPQHAAKLSHLQSLLPRGDRTTLKDINKFVREIYHQKDEKVSVYDLRAENDEGILGWSDAALANRVDLSSTGGFVIGFAHRKMLDGVQGPVSLVSWSTHKLRRVCRSSQAQALAECEAEFFSCPSSMTRIARR